MTASARNLLFFTSTYCEVALFAALIIYFDSFNRSNNTFFTIRKTKKRDKQIFAPFLVKIEQNDGSVFYEAVMLKIIY